jgi:hypothetical protein
MKNFFILLLLWYGVAQAQPGVVQGQKSTEVKLLTDVDLTGPATITTPFVVFDHRQYGTLLWKIETDSTYYIDVLEAADSLDCTINAILFTVTEAGTNLFSWVRDTTNGYKRQGGANLTTITVTDTSNLGRQWFPLQGIANPISPTYGIKFEIVKGANHLTGSPAKSLKMSLIFRYQAG